MFFLPFFRRLWQALTSFGIRNDSGTALCRMPNLTSKIRDENLSGSGRSSDVYKATYSTGFTSKQIAVKSLRTSIPSHTERSESEELLVQANAWMALQHDNILTPLGYVEGFGPLPSIVYKWMHGGTLTSYLQNYGALSLVQRLSLIKQMSAGLCYLHYKNVIHGNLYGNNILIDARGVPYLADYELNGAYQGQHLHESVRWTAPERLGSGGVGGTSYPPTTKSDVYSLGGLMYQILTGRPPYYDVRSIHKISAEILKGNQPLRPSDVHIMDRHWLFIQNCWSLPGNRPSAAQLLHFAQSEIEHLSQ